MISRLPTSRIERLFEMFTRQSVGVQTLSVDADDQVIGCNAAMAALLDRSEEDIRGKGLHQLMTEESLGALQAHLGQEGAFLVNFVDRHQVPQTLTCCVARDEHGFLLVGESPAASDRRLTTALLEINDELSTLARENARKSRVIEKGRQRLAAALTELQTSYWHLEKIGEVLPSCLACGRVKSLGTSWESVADYLRKNSLFLSHGYCPDCRDRVGGRSGITRKGELDG